MGTLIIEQALQHQQRPVLAGRNAAKLRPIAEKYGLESRTFDIHEVQGQLEGVLLVLNLAGPYSATCEPLVQACLAAGAHYLDIANEIPAYQTIRRYDTQAREQGVALIPGVGFGVVPTDMLSSYVARKLPDASALHIAMIATNASKSSTTARTTLEVISRGGWMRQDGKLVSARLGSHLQQVRFPNAERTLILAPLGDLETAYWSTHIPNITTYIETSSRMAPFIMPLMRQLVRVPALREKLASASTSQAAASPATVPHSYAWAKAVDSDGKQVQAWLEMGEGLAFTASASLLAVERTRQSHLCGALSPAMAFGVDFVLDIPGVTRMDTL